MKNKLRDSNYELLRIISMFAIVLHHTITHGMILENTTGVINFIFRILLIFCVFHVNCFILTTGYYQSTSKPNIKKVLSIILQVFFYNLIINSILKISGLISYTTIDFLRQINPLNFSSYWFLQCYLVTYLLSPYINDFIQKADRIFLKKCIFILFLCVSIIPYFTFAVLYSNNGFNVFLFILMYFIGAYIKKYNLNDELLKQINITQKRFIYLSVFIGFTIINCALYYMNYHMMNIDNSIINYIGGHFEYFTILYNNPIVIIQSVSLFLFFGTFKFKNKFVNILGKLTLGVYLIHQSYYIKNNLYIWLKIDTGNIIDNKMFIIKAILITILIYIISSIIEFIRQLIFKIIAKSKIQQKISNNTCNWLQRVLEIK